MKTLTQEERDSDAQKAKEEAPHCIGCGEEAIGSWGLCIGRRSPFHYTPSMPYCRDHMSDMIGGLELVVRDLKSMRKKWQEKEQKEKWPT